MSHISESRMLKPLKAMFRPGGLSSILGQILWVGSVGIHDPYIPSSTDALPVGLKGDFGSVGRPSRSNIGGGVLGQVLQIGSVGIHDVDINVAVAGGFEGDFGSVGRPSRSKEGGVLGQIFSVGV